MAEKLWERQIVEIRSLLFLQVRSRREEHVEEQGDSTDAARIKQPNTMFEFGLPSIKLIAYSKRTSAVPRSVRTCRPRFLLDSFILSFSFKSMTRSMPLNWLLSNTFHFYRF